MNQVTINCIDEMVFMEQKHCFEKPDVILYHPGHFPELNDQLIHYYQQSRPNLIMIPGVFNSFLNCSEYEFYAPLLIQGGVEKEKLKPIPNHPESNGVNGVVQSAFQYLNKTENKNILLAGKSFFSRRFYLLASLYANKDKVLDVLPLHDNRGIIPGKWPQSEKGIARVLNEIKQYGEIVTEKIVKNENILNV